MLVNGEWVPHLLVLAGNRMLPEPAAADNGTLTSDIKVDYKPPEEDDEDREAPRLVFTGGVDLHGMLINVENGFNNKDRRAILWTVAKDKLIHLQHVPP